MRIVLQHDYYSFVWGLYTLYMLILSKRNVAIPWQYRGATMSFEPVFSKSCLRQLALVQLLRSWGLCTDAWLSSRRCRPVRSQRHNRTTHDWQCSCPSLK